MSTSSSERAIIGLAALVLLIAVVGRLHNIASFPAMYDYDAGGAAVNVLSLLEGELPPPASWSGRHPPLYFAIGALLCGVLPEAIPMHVTLRLVSVVAWLMTVGLVWRALRRLAAPADAAAVSALCLGIPGVVITSCMMTNDPLAALFTTAVLVRLLDPSSEQLGKSRHAAITAVLGGMAGLTKATGLAAIVTAVVAYGWVCRGEWRVALRQALLVALVGAVLAGPHYARLLWASEGPAYLVLGGHVGSQEHEVVSDLVLAAAPIRAGFASFSTLFHESVWGDAIGVYLPRSKSPIALVLLVAGLLVWALALAGVVQVVRRRELMRRAGILLAFGLFYTLALAPAALMWPYMILTKVNYLLPLILPFGVLLTAGLAALRGSPRVVLRAALLMVAVGGIGVTWYGWWQAASPGPSIGVTRPVPASGSALVVAKYFEDRARDPIRAIRLLTPELELRHELRLTSILGLQFSPSPDMPAEERRSLELARARLAWLELYNLERWIAPMAAALRYSAIDVREKADASEVTVRIEAVGPHPAADMPYATSWPFVPFLQRFALRRDGAHWTIAEIEQLGVVAGNAAPALAAYPTLAALRDLRDLER